MARPRPVPPKRRVTDASAWENFWNSLPRCSGEIPSPVSRTMKRSTGSARLPCLGDLNRNMAALGEFNPVAGEVEQNLTEARWVTDPGASCAWLDQRRDLNPLFAGARREDGGDALDEVVNRKGKHLKLDRARLQFRDVEDVVENAEEGLGALLCRLHIGALFDIQLGIEQDLRHAQDPVHRRTDLVAHVGQETPIWPRWRPPLVVLPDGGPWPRPRVRLPAPRVVPWPAGRPRGRGCEPRDRRSPPP